MQGLLSRNHVPGTLPGADAEEMGRTASLPSEQSQSSVGQLMNSVLRHSLPSAAHREIHGNVQEGPCGGLGVFLPLASIPPPVLTLKLPPLVMTVLGVYNLSGAASQGTHPLSPQGQSHGPNQVYFFQASAAWMEG